MINTVSQFLWVRNSVAVELSGSESESLVSAARTSAGAASPEGSAGAGGSTFKMAHSHSAWQEAFVPHQQSSPEGCLSVLRTWQLASPSMPRSKREEGGWGGAFCDLVFEVTNQYSYHGAVLQGESLSLSAHAQGERN